MQTVKSATAIVVLILFCCTITAINCLSFNSGYELNRETCQIVKELQNTFPELNDKQTNNANDMFRHSFNILKGFTTGSIKPIHIIQNITNIQDIHNYLPKPTLIAVVASKVPQGRAPDEQLFQLDSMERNPSSLLHTLFIPYMNILAKSVESKAKKPLYATKLARLPSHLATRELIAIYDIGNGVLWIHETFFETFKDPTLLDLVPAKVIVETYEKMMKIIPDELSTKKMMNAIQMIPDFISQLSGPTALCIACMSVLNIVVPFILNYICYYIAAAVCVMYKLPQEQCTKLEASSLMVAFALTFPAAVVIWKVCHTTVCVKQGTLLFRVGTTSAKAMLSFVKSVVRI
jgi:hypothetical protein